MPRTRSIGSCSRSEPRSPRSSPCFFPDCPCSPPVGGGPRRLPRGRRTRGREGGAERGGRTARRPPTGPARRGRSSVEEPARVPGQRVEGSEGRSSRGFADFADVRPAASARRIPPGNVHEVVTVGLGVSRRGCGGGQWAGGSSMAHLAGPRRLRPRRALDAGDEERQQGVETGRAPPVGRS